MPKRLAFLLLLYAFSKNVTAQTIGDSTSYGSTANIISIYYTGGLGEQSPLYNGIEYLEYASMFREGHPFFESQEFKHGEIYFDGMSFHKVPMCYDLVKDLVVILNFHNTYKIVLPTNKIQQFTLLGHTFVRIQHDSLNQIKTGFYDQLYKGKIGLFAKREKKIVERVGFSGIDVIVNSMNTYYIMKGGNYYNFKNQRGLLNILNDKKREILQHFKKNNIRFKDDPEEAMKAAVEYCNRLTN